VRPAPGQQVALDAAAREVVEQLVRGERLAAGQGDQFRAVVAVEVADAPVADLAGAPQRLEALQRLLQRPGAAPVQQVEVEAVGAEDGAGWPRRP